MVLPALADLAGKAVITFVGRQPGLDYIRTFVHRGLDFEGDGWHMLFLDSPDEHCLPVSRADLVVAFFSDEAGKISQNLNACFPHVPVHVFPSFPSEKENMHAARYIAECLKSAGLPFDKVPAWGHGSARRAKQDRTASRLRRSKEKPSSRVLAQNP
ncbi:MAG: hypothetical protein JRJ21_06240 [Deltaproteobacteria bacterium]|nr:hypothetical protein [Deltaproteobacteria bacterium]